MSDGAQARIAKLTAVPWWRFGEPGRLRYPVKSRADGATRAAAALRAGAVTEVADALLGDEWRTHGWALAPNTNRWHPQLSTDRQRLSEQITTDAISREIYSDAAPTGRSPGRYPNCPA